MFLSKTYTKLNKQQNVNYYHFGYNFFNVGRRYFSMNLHEYQAQGLLKRYNVPIPNVLFILNF